MKKFALLLVPFLLSACTGSVGGMAGASSGSGSQSAVGGSASVTFTGTGSSNADPTPFNPTTIMGNSSGNAGAPASTISLTSYSAAGATGAARILSIIFPAKPAAGQTYNLNAGIVASGQGSSTATVSYAEGTGTFTGGSAKAWIANGGTLAITSVSGSNVGFSITNATMTATTASSSNSAANAATGTFTLNATGTATNYSGL